MANDHSNESFASLTRRDLTSAFSRHKWSAIVVSLILMPAMLFGVMLIPAQFDSYGQILVRLGRGSVSMDPTTSLTQTVSLQESRASQVNSVVEMLQSRAVAERVVKKVGAGRILEPHDTLSKWTDKVMGLIPSSTPSGQGDLTGSEVSQQLEHEAAVNAFYGMFGVFTVKDVYTINVEVRSGSSFLSRDILQATMDEYQRYHVLAHQSPGTLEFFENQSELAFRDAVQAKEELREAKTARGIIEIDSAKSSLRSMISQVESDLLTTTSDIAATRAEKQQLANDIDALPSTVQTETVTGIAKVAGNTIRQSLYELEVRYQDLSSKLKPGHPQLNALEKQLESAAEIAKTELGDQPQSKESLNPIRQSLELSLRTADSRLAGLTSKKSSLEIQQLELDDQLAQLNTDEVELAQLSWESTLTESIYLKAAESRDQAKQLADLDTQNVSEISVVQPATLGLKKVRPQRSILAVLAILLAGTLGFGQAVIRGLFDANSRLSNPRPTNQHGGSWADDESNEATADQLESALAGVPR